MNKCIYLILGLAVLAVMGGLSSQAEARTNVSLNFAGFFNSFQPAPRPVVMAPVYPAPYYEQVVVYNPAPYGYTYVQPAYPCYPVAAPCRPVVCQQQFGISVSKDYHRCHR